MTPEFKFGIGDIVRLKGGPTKRYMPEDYMIVVERLMQECPGGIQLHYSCRIVSQRGGCTTQYVRFMELELELRTEQQDEVEEWTTKRHCGESEKATPGAMHEVDHVEVDVEVQKKP